ncbi:phosphate ABC transporter permease PstA [Halorarum halophilum]|uniref:Phosphate transport system permease protein PstA n=1 Tax=Halorarum halophilum TaxID=2743090 RepID=A0A7D5KG28_9EURY|nr:phosphate ABC transporter permease PstA [Halobaculum halophilum]QLG28016.1 phosphate ABC transporter permease PstA [Halobaculum halophilum]
MSDETSSRSSDRNPLTGEHAVSRLRGRVFEAVTFGATAFGIVTVTFLLAYVFNDALRPLTADAGWYLVFLGVLVVPTLALVGYYYLRDPAAGEVALAATGIPVVGLLVGGGLVVLFVEIVTPVQWFGTLLVLLLAAAVVLAHRRLRPDAAVERLAVTLLAPLLAVVGVPAVAVDWTARTPLTGTELFTVAFSTPELLSSVPELFGALPIRPVGWVLLVASVTVPTAFLFGRIVAHRREDDRGVWETIAASVVVVSAGVFLAPLVGLNAENWVVLASVTVIPTGTYLEGVLRRREGTSGLAFPVVLVAGGLLGTTLVGALGFAGPEAWLDWGFLTSPTSRDPERAGIYPPLVGSVMMLVVIVVSAFPVGVAAAVYLEEYAPDGGIAGRLVDLIEINIGNLAGVPSVVYGLLGLALFIKGMDLQSGIVVVGGLTVGLLVLPIIIISAQESIRAVPDSQCRASYGMGATRWQTTRNVVLPRALPGILTGTILALGRAIGETAPLLMIGAASSVRLAPDGFFDKFSAMPRQIFAWSSEFDADFRFGVLAAGVVTLLVVLLVMNGTAILVRNRYQRGR